MEDCKGTGNGCRQDYVKSGKTYLENDRLRVEVKTHGAEMCSIFNKENGKQYLWNGDPKFWGRTSPVLFPFVGGLRNKEYRYQGKSYPMTQHGFARDMDFILIEQKKEEVWFRLEDNEETYKNYPFHFRLDIGYHLQESEVTVMWRVENMEQQKEMYFSIGAHPAFVCPLDQENRREEYFLRFKAEDGECLSAIKCRELGSEGLVISDVLERQAVEGMYSVREKLFEGDTLILEGNQAKEVSLLHPTKEPYVTVRFNAPLVGVWTPYGKNAPFVCIEPWYGRCDSSGFDGSLEQREWGNELRPGECFEASYRIIIEEGASR